MMLIPPDERDAARGRTVEREQAVARALADGLLERMTDAFIALDREWRVVYMNSAARQLNAKPRADVIGRSHWEEWPTTVGSAVERQYRHAMATQQAVYFEHHYVLPGHDYWHSIHAYPDANGLSIFYRDITRQKRAQDLANVLVSAGARFAETLDQPGTLRILAEAAVPLLGQWSCVYLVDEAWRVTAVETAASDPRQHAMLRQVAAQLPEYATDVRLPFNRAMHVGEAVLLAEVTESFYEALGTQTLQDFALALAPQSLLCVPLIARGRNIGGITFGTTAPNRRHDEQDVVAARELSLPGALALDNARLYEAERRARREAEEARQRAEHANRTKVDFLRAMSHELRTPLTAIGGYVQLLRMGVRGDLTPLQRSDLDRVERNQQHIASLINDVLSFARLDAGHVEFDCKSVRVDDLLSRLEGFAAPQVDSGGHQVRIRAHETDLEVLADASKATQILVNLIGNGTKHTPPNSVIEVFCEAPLGEARVRICVRDNGPGIARDQQQSIFEPFVQLNRRLNQPMEGLGLGLAIARDLARGMGGDLTVESELGQGATFSLVLPRVAHSQSAGADQKH